MTYFLSLIAAALVVIAAGLYYATVAVRSQWLGRTDYRGRRDTQSVSLTFDDGPSCETAQILEVLAAHGVQATFFMMGERVEEFPEIARQVASEGHEVGNHSYSHQMSVFQRAQTTYEELQRTQTVIGKIVGIKPRLARPPYGVRTRAYFNAAHALGLRILQWDVSGFDWKRRNARQIADAVLRDTRPGSIILLHDGDSAGKSDRRETVAALPLILAGLQALNLSVVPIDQLLIEEGSETAPQAAV